MYVPIKLYLCIKVILDFLGSLLKHVKGEVQKQFFSPEIYEKDNNKKGTQNKFL